MSDDAPVPAADSRTPASPTKPPWWLITGWIRWAYFGFVLPGVLGWSAIERLQTGRGHALDAFMLVVLAASAVFALVQLVLTLRAYRRDPSLRTREWPGPPPGPGVSRRVWITIALIAVAALGVVLLIYGGWPGALFVVAILLGLLVLFVRFDLFADDPPPVREPADSGRTHQQGQTPGR